MRKMALHLAALPRLHFVTASYAPFSELLVRERKK
jgi:hypothetical protein